MSTSRTTTTTVTSATTAGPSRSRTMNPPPADPVDDDEEELGEDNDEAIRRAEEKVHRMKARKAAAAAKKKAEEEAAKKAAEEARRREEAATRELEERRRLLATAATARSQRGTSPRKGKAKAQPVDEDPDDGDDGDDDDDDKEPCEQCRMKKISCQMQAGKRSSIICKPCHDAKVRCSYSGRPSTVKREGGSNPTGERLAVLESQVAQLLADNWQLRDGQVKANTYHRHFNQKLDWLITDAARRRRSPPEMPEAGPSGLSRKRCRVVDSDEEEAREVEKDGEETAPAEKGKEREA
ncbi:hypothetical protein F5879DRAFT_995736 [Lentinula edodes]|nr:hypothetical protein F5879DRAFT_995736 [Lentinula edodes]